MEVGLTWGRKNAPFIFPSPTPDTNDTYTRPGKRREIALLHAPKQTLAACATRMNNLSIQGNPKADFLE
jgi:hypothetical protein